MKKKYVIGLDGSGIDELIAAVDEYERWLKSCAEELVRRLAERGYEISSAGFESAVYDGEQGGVTVSVENRGELHKAVIALGETVLFIEFGTGITYPDVHPEAAKNGMIRGSYGLGHGKQQTWGYYGEPGTNGKVVRETNKGTLVLTHGNPANMPMYNGAKAMREEIAALVKEIFV